MTPTPAAELRDLRARLGLSQARLAALLNQRIPGLSLAQQHVARWESGAHQPHPALLYVLRQMAEEHERNKPEPVWCTHCRAKLTADEIEWIGEWCEKCERRMQAEHEAIVKAWEAEEHEKEQTQ